MMSCYTGERDEQLGLGSKHTNNPHFPRILQISNEMAAFLVLFSIEKAAISIEIRSANRTALTDCMPRTATVLFCNPRDDDYTIGWHRDGGGTEGYGQPDHDTVAERTANRNVNASYFRIFD